MNQEPLDKKKGVADIVILLDASGSMETCIRSVADNIAAFIDTLGEPDANGGVTLQDWRLRVIGFRDRDVDGSAWLIDTHFSTSRDEIKANLSSIKAAGGGDEPESLLDAMYLISQWPSEERGTPPSRNNWRYRSDATRVVIIFTDASCKSSFIAADGSKGNMVDLINLYHAARLKVVLFAPDAPCYAELSAMNGLEWEPIGNLDDNPQEALRNFTSDVNNFKEVMKALAKTVSVASAVPIL